MQFVAHTVVGLEGLLAEEVSRRFPVARHTAARGRVQFEGLESLPELGDLLVCDRLNLIAREALGRFGGLRGLAEVRGKVARTDLNRALADWVAVTGRTPHTFRMHAVVASACDFAFFDLLREIPPILQRRSGLAPADDAGDVVIDLDCATDVLTIGLRVPLRDWGASPRRELPRSLAGALIRLARPASGLAVCDPDCGEGELLAAWRLAVGGGRAIGLTRVRPRSTPPPGVVVASPRGWPLPAARVSRVVSALPRIGSPVQLAHLLSETARCLAPGGCAAVATTLTKAWRAALEAQPRLLLEQAQRVATDAGPVDVIVLLRSADGQAPHRTLTTAGDRARATQKLQRSIEPNRGTPPRRGRRGTKKGAFPARKPGSPRRPGT